MRRASGITCVAETTGKVLLLRRSAYVRDPGLWSVPAGAVDPGETPLEAAVRELWEEAGYDGLVVIEDGWKEPDVPFWHFIGMVPKQFAPKLNWENDAAGWFDPKRPPAPLHPGMAAVLSRL